MGSFDELGIGPESEAAMKDFDRKKPSSLQRKYADAQELLSNVARAKGALQARFPGSQRPDAFVIVPDGSGGASAQGVFAKEFRDQNIPMAPKEPTENRVISPSRTYVVVCNKGGFDGHYMRKFWLPLEDPGLDKNGIKAGDELDNNATTAMWYFLNRLDTVACASMVMTWEDFQNVRDCAEIEAERILVAAEEAITKQANDEKDGEDMYPDFQP